MTDLSFVFPAIGVKANKREGESGQEILWPLLLRLLLFCGFLKVIGRSTKVNRVFFFPGQTASRPQAVGRSWWSRNMRSKRPKSECTNLVDFDFSLTPHFHLFLCSVYLFVL